MQSSTNDNDAHPITTVLPTTSDVTYDFPATTATSSNIKATAPTKASETMAATTTTATAVATKKIVVNPTTTPGNKPEHNTFGYAQDNFNYTL